MMTRFLLVVSVLALAVAAGCSGDMPTVPSDPAVMSAQDTGRAPWGIWEIWIDRETLAVEVLPVRFGEFHANVRQFLEHGPCFDCLKISPPIVPQPYGMDVTIALTHPFAGLSQFTGFDVRGIAMFEGTFSFPWAEFTSPLASSGDPALLNPDGYTTAFNANDYTLSGILGYSHGKMIPPTWPNPPNSLNGFKAYFSEGQSEDEGGRRAFFTGDTITRTFEIQVPAGNPFKFWYAVDASWVKPAGNAPYELEDFPLDANCPEVYRFDFSVISGELYPDSGSVTIGMDAWDHQGWGTAHQVNIEAPQCFDGGLGMVGPPEWVDGEKAHWTLGVINSIGGLDPEKGAEFLVTLVNEDDDPLTGPIHGYGRFTIPVMEGPALPPVVFSINPDYGVQDSALDNALVTGGNFQDGCTLLLRKPGEGDIVAFDVEFINIQHIAGDFDFASAALGLWDVVVINPDMLEGSLPEGFEIVEPSGCNDALHENYLGTGDFGGGTHMKALDAVFVHDTGTETDGEFLGYISGFGGTVVIPYIIDTLFPEEGHGLGGGWGNPHIGSWPVPYSIDVSEEYGQFFITWDDAPSIVEVWETTGKLGGDTDASNKGRVFCLDTDGSGGFWDVYFPEYGFAHGVKHFTPDGPQPGQLVENTADAFGLPEAWGIPTEIICIPDDTLLILAGSEGGRIRAYDISVTPPVLKGTMENIFSENLHYGDYPYRNCDMAVDWSDTDFAHCRIIVYGNLESGGVELIKIDADLNVWAGPTKVADDWYMSMDINPDTGDLALWPSIEDGPGVYALIEQPPSW